MIKPTRTLEKLQSGKPVTIGALGDSLTHGWMVRKGFLDFLREMLLRRYPRHSVTIINRGLPGDTADNGLFRLKRDILGDHPDCVFVQYALNDAFQGCPIQQFKASIKAIIDETQANSDADIVLLTSVYLADKNAYNYARTYYRQLEDLAADYRLPVARVHDYWEKKVDGGVDFSPLVQDDWVHPTETGYRYMAEAVMELFL